MKTKIKKLVSLIFLAVYFIGIYWFLSLTTEYPLTVIITMLASIVFMITTHELGHLVAGLLTGYKFVSFRIFSFMLVKDGDKFRFRRMSIPGTGGQCLMSPPRKKKGDYYPFALYNLGGILLCGYLSLFVIVIAFFFENATVRMLLFLFGFISFVMNLFNAIPTGGKSMANDATNLRMALKSKTAADALWNQLEYVSLHAQNIRTADMPEELFFTPKKEELSNPLIVWQILANVERAEDNGEYEKARSLVSFALQNAPYMIPLYKSALQLEAIYLDCVLQSDSDRADEYYEKISKMPALQSLISFHRASYAYLLLRKKDLPGAEKALFNFLKKIQKAPFQAEANFEKQQLAYIQQIND